MSREELEELRERLQAADKSLRALAGEYESRATRRSRGLEAINYWKHYDRLEAKAEGVRLSLSYVEEILRRY